MRKIIGRISIIALLVCLLARLFVGPFASVRAALPVAPRVGGPYYNYGEAMQKAILFYKANRLGDLPAKGYASHGESWALALALRLASYRLLRDDDVEPVLILDDVFAELDADRRERLAEMVADAEQVLVTAAVAADVPSVLHGARIDVRREPEA